jgi:hypothetical protein
MRLSFLILPLSCAVLAIAAIVAFTNGGSASTKGPAPEGERTVASTAMVGELLHLKGSDFFFPNLDCPLKIGDADEDLGGFSTACQDMRAPFHLPNGSIIRSIKGTYVDNEPFENIFIDVHENPYGPGAGTSHEASGYLPSTSGPGITDGIIVSPGLDPVDNLFAHYEIRLLLELESFRVHSLVIDYERPADGGGGGINGDADCSGGVDNNDTLAILKHEAGFSDAPGCAIG